MSPKSLVYKSNSIIYFKGDISDKIFILNQGKISLNSINIETGVDVHELIKTGEFFGVKSALGRYPREETAVVLTDSKVIAFSVPEFEQLVSKNTRIILKMLKVFSTQLRRIHKQVQSLLNFKEQINPELGLFTIGEYYLKAKKYKQAIYAFDRYRLFYPSGKNTALATKNIQLAEQELQKLPPESIEESGAPPPPLHDPSLITPERKGPTTSELTDSARDYYAGVNLISKEKFEDALEIFKSIIARNTDEEYAIKAQFEIGKCLFLMKKYENCIKIFTALIQKYPKHPDFTDILNFIAQCYEALGDTQKAVQIYRKVLSLCPPADPLYNKVNRSLKILEKA